MKKKNRVLVALMGLDIGGAETHAVELIRGLVKNNYRFMWCQAEACMKTS